MFLSQYFQTVNTLSKLLTILTVETVEFNKNPFEIAIQKQQQERPAQH